MTAPRFRSAPFQTPTRSVVLYADRHLKQPAIIDALKTAFGLNNLSACAEELSFQAPRCCTRISDMAFNTVLAAIVCGRCIEVTIKSRGEIAGSTIGQLCNRPSSSSPRRRKSRAEPYSRAAP